MAVSVQADDEYTVYVSRSSRLHMEERRSPMGYARFLGIDENLVLEADLVLDSGQPGPVLLSMPVRPCTGSSTGFLGRWRPPLKVRRPLVDPWFPKPDRTRRIKSQK